MTKFMSTECLHVPYAKLDDFNTCELIVQRCTGHGLNRERFRLLNSLNISQNVPKVMRELATVEVS